MNEDSSNNSSDTEDSDMSAGLLEFPEISDHQRGGNPSAPRNHGGEDEDEDEEIYFNLPPSLKKLQSALLHGYSTPQECPDFVPMPRDLTSSEMLSLKHFIAWKKSNGTVLAYKLHAKVLQSATNIEIMSLHSVKKLATTLTDLIPLKVDMCPHSCIAYTGEFEVLESCPYIHKGVICGEPRYQAKATPTEEDKPRAQMLALPVTPTIRAMFANVETSNLLRE